MIGKKIFDSRIFYYPYKSNYKIVVSDIDGTVTKSDILGHILPKVFLNWEHKNIVQFFKTIIDHNYLLVFLTAWPVS